MKFRKHPNIPENCVKLYAVIQTLNHLLCSKLQPMKSFYKSIQCSVFHYVEWSNFYNTVHSFVEVVETSF